MRATLFQPGQACLEGGGRQRLHVDVHHLGQIGRFRRGEIAGRDRSHDGARRRNGIRHLVERREIERDRLVPARRQQPVHADAQRRDVSVLGQVDRSAGDACGFFRAPSFSFKKLTDRASTQ